MPVTRLCLKIRLWASSPCILKPLTTVVLDTMASVADEIAIGIHSGVASEALVKSEEKYRFLQKAFRPSPTLQNLENGSLALRELTIGIRTGIHASRMDVRLCALFQPCAPDDRLSVLTGKRKQDAPASWRRNTG